MNPRTKQGRVELRVLCENATAGPWAVHDCGGRYESDNLRACGIVTESKSLRPWSSVPMPLDVIVSDSRDECSHPIGDADAIFIARARTALPEALDALEAAEAVIEAARPFRHMSVGFRELLAAYDAKRGE